MNINRSNYEIWFIDWLDGNLNNFQTKELNNFLALTPDLKEEFNDLSTIPLVSPENNYPFKNELKRSSEEISESQFAYLCAAYIEKDLSDLQKSEIDEIVANDTKKKRIFEHISKTQLTSADIKYKHKKQLLKRTAAQKIIRLSIIGLSSAAAIALILATFITIPRNLQYNINTEALVSVTDSNSKLHLIENNRALILSSDSKQKENFKKIENKSSSDKSDHTKASVAVQSENKMQDSELRITNEAGVEKIKAIELKGLNRMKETDKLALSYIYVRDEDLVDERGKIGKSIAKTFREKVLKEKNPPDSPLKAYEIAEVGVTGINKFFGWEMALDKRNDENGDIKSVYFSSRIIKFNAPVKKSEPLP